MIVLLSSGEKGTDEARSSEQIPLFIGASVGVNEGKKTITKGQFAGGCANI
jgi:hypothetical protein